MPTYEYVCAKGHTFEEVQKMSDPPIGSCPQCGAAAERRLSGGAGLIFKGSGFYITDYGKDGKGPRKEPEAPAAASAGSAPTDSDSSGTAAPAPASSSTSPTPTTKPAE